MYLLLQYGKTLESTKLEPNSVIKPTKDFFALIKDTLVHNVTHPLAILILQIITVIFTARTFGFIFNKIGQPTVIGEIVAGIFLGPSLLGMWFPDYSAFLFPVASLGNLQFLSQVGLVLFMFVIGMELDLKSLKNRAADAVIISHASIIIPYSFGMVLAYYLYIDYAPKNIQFISFALFMGIAMSITAFPVLARIIQERNLSKTRLGAIAITCAAADDISAWCILAAVIAIVKAGSVVSSLYTIVMALIYVLIMIKVVQPFLKKLGEVFSSRESLSLNVVSAIFGILLISAYTAEVIGIHALFGAFLAGAIMPSTIGFRRIIIEKVESVSLGLLLPLFFVFTGLRTQIGLLNEGHLWGVCATIIGIAILGKFGGSTFAAKFVGNTWKDSLSIGALMNTRGLMELIVLNIGYDLGVLSPEIFAMMVIMALATTFMTGPALDLINYLFRSEVEPLTTKTKQKFRVLLSFANPKSGAKLVKVANVLTGYTKNNTDITALHITPNTEANQFQLQEYEKESFKPIKIESQKLGLKIKTVYKVSTDVSDEILKDANSASFDLMLVGVGQNVFKGSLLGQFISITASALNPEKLMDTLTGRTSLFKSQQLLDEKSNEFINKSKIPVGVLIEHDLEKLEKILLSISSISDVFLLFYAKKILKNSNVAMHILDNNGVIESNSELKEEIENLENFSGENFKLLNAGDFNATTFSGYDLLILSVDGWKEFSKKIDTETEEETSILLLRP